MAVLNNRLSLSADYYIKDTKDMLVAVPVKMWGLGTTPS